MNPNPEPGPSADIDELRADIDATRQQLGETVSALSDKLDVKGRVEQKAAETKADIAHRPAELSDTVRRRPAIPVGAVVAVAALVGAVIWLRRRR